MLTNLIGNAWKFTATRDVAHIEVGRVAGSVEGTVFVRDDGVGFDPASADELFQPFQRVCDTCAFEGVGIGLATVRRAIVRMGGRCWAEGEPGVGATFSFSLPTGGGPG